MYMQLPVRRDGSCSLWCCRRKKDDTKKKKDQAKILGKKGGRTKLSFKLG